MILNTPTGSGKSLVAAAAHFAALAAGRAQRVHGADQGAGQREVLRTVPGLRVGQRRDDHRRRAVNADAPIICCTAEILANWRCATARRTDVDVVIVDEFHYYGDPQRGWAWQLPLLELPDVQFLLMSATLGDVGFFQRRSRADRTGR